MFGVDSEADALWFPPSRIGIKAALERAEGSMKSLGERRGKPLQKFILAQIHSLDYVSAVV